MKMKYAFAIIGIVALGFVGCQSFIRPTPERDAEVATAVGDAIAFRKHGMADEDSQSAAAGVLTLQEAVLRALRTDSTIQVALSKVRVAEAESAQNRLLPNPVITLAFRMPDAGTQPIIDVSLAAELLSLLKKPGQIKAADFRLRAASSEAVIQVLDVLAEVRAQYASVQTFDALTPVLEERQNILDRLIRIANARLENGEGARLDLTILKAQRTELEIEIIEQESERRESRLGLSRLIGSHANNPAWSVMAWTEPQIADIAQEGWIRIALEHRPEIQAKQWELSALGVEENLAKLAFLDGSEIGVDAERDGTWSAGPSVAMALPIFDWGQAQRARVDALITQGWHDLTASRHSIIKEVRSAHLSLQSSLAVYRMSRDRLIPLLEQRRNEADALYRAGETDILPLILADQELQAARARKIEVEHKTTESLIRLERAVGGPGYMPAGPSATEPQTSPSTRSTIQRNNP